MECHLMAGIPADVTMIKKKLQETIQQMWLEEVEQGFSLKIILLRAIFLNGRKVCEEARKLSSFGLERDGFSKQH